MAKLIVTAMAMGLIFLALVSAPPAAAAQPGATVKLGLAQGQSASVPELGLTVKAVAVRDFTSQGCLGGAQGCPDGVDLLISRGAESLTIELRLAHTRVQASQGIDRAEAFGHFVALVALQHGRATLTIDSRR